MVSGMKEKLKIGIKIGKIEIKEDIENVIMFME